MLSVLGLFLNKNSGVLKYNITIDITLCEVGGNYTANGISNSMGYSNLHYQMVMIIETISCVHVLVCWFDDEFCTSCNIEQFTT